MVSNAAAKVLLDGLNAEALNERKILAFDGQMNSICYVEGYSPVVYVTEGGSGWFCFEEPFHVAALELLKLGFTIDEIREARKS